MILSPMNIDFVDNNRGPLYDWVVFEETLDEIVKDIKIKQCYKEVIQWITDNRHHTFPRSIKKWCNALNYQYDCIDFVQDIVDQLVSDKIVTTHGILRFPNNDRKRLRESDSVIEDNNYKKLKKMIM